MVDGLATRTIIGCDGTITHELVVELDGTVAVRDAHGHRVVVDPRTRTQVTPTPTLSRGLLDAACALAREVGA